MKALNLYAGIGGNRKRTLIDCPTCRYLRRRIDERNKN